MKLLNNREDTMNRRKKGNQILKARAKKANAKLSSKSKPKYVSKADRETSIIEPTEVKHVVSEE
ncbi:MAG: hypothetical protein ACJA0T_003291 [Colwellia sp.]|jgi:hypothetical protein